MTIARGGAKSASVVLGCIVGEPPMAEPTETIDWQSVALDAQLYLLLASEQFAAYADHRSVDTERCEYVLAQAIEHGARPSSPETILARYLKSKGWPILPGDEMPPFL